MTHNSSPKPPAGWFDDPNDPLKLQWWDGAQWSGVRKDKEFSEPAGDQLRFQNKASSFVSDKVGRFANRLADVTGDADNKAENHANGAEDVAGDAEDVAGDVADGVAEGAGCVFRLLKGIVMLVLFPLWLILMLFGCGPYS